MISKSSYLLIPVLLLCVCTACGIFSGSSGDAAIIAPANRTDRLRLEITEFARQQVGAKYKYGGRNPKGFDCSGFTHYVMARYDVALPTNSGMQSSEGKRIDVDRAKPGDLIFFKRSKLGKVFHVALIVSNNSEGIKVVHSTSSRGVIMENVSKSSYWAPKIWATRTVLP